MPHNNYLLVTDSSDEEDTDAECYILKDTSSEADADAVYEFVEDDTELISHLYTRTIWQALLTGLLYYSHRNI